MRGEAEGYAFKTTEPRIAEQLRLQTGPDVGPGTYDLNRLANGLPYEMTANLGEASAKNVFASGSTQGMTFVIDPDLPGPGQYDPDKLRDGKNATLADMRGEMGSASFNSGTQRAGFSNGRAAQTAPEVGPGAYDLSKMHNGLNWAMSDGRGESASAAMKSKTSVGLQMDLHGVDVPGPGSYDPQKRMDGTNGTLTDMRGENASSAFKSKVPINGKVMWETVVDTPGPGTYDATKLPTGEHSQVADMRGEAEGYAFKTTEPRIAEQLRLQTGPDVGPGSYDLDKLRTGEQWEMVHSTYPINAGTPAFLSEVERSDPTAQAN